MVFEILTVTIKVTLPDGQVREKRSTVERGDLDWTAQQYSEVNDNAKVVIIHNNEVVATFPQESN